MKFKSLFYYARAALFWLFVISITAMIMQSAHAQQLKVATGSKEGTYAAMFREINQTCAAAIPMIEQTTSGSMENVNLLIGNQVNAGFVQTDVLYFRARTEDLGNVKTLLALHPEEVHVLTTNESFIKEGGYVGIGSKPVVFNTVSDLANRRVGAVGGSAITAQVIRLQGEVPFSVVEYPNNDELLKAIAAGNVEAGVFVGGSPLGAIAKLKEGWKLLPFNEALVSKLKAVYRPTRLNYQNIRQMGITSVATDALFVTREYKTAKMVDGLAKLRGCVLEHLDELKETTGTHPKWQAVDAANEGKWNYYRFPAAAAAAKTK